MKGNKMCLGTYIHANVCMYALACICEHDISLWALQWEQFQQGLDHKF